MIRTMNKAFFSARRQIELAPPPRPPLGASDCVLGVGLALIWLVFTGVTVQAQNVLGPAQPTMTSQDVVGVGPSATTRGPDTAAVTILEFSDFECPFCQRANPVVEEVLAAYPDQVQLLFKHLPLPIHRNAPLAHEAALAAAVQGKFWDMHDLLFANQDRLAPGDLQGYGADLGLDPVAFEEAISKRTFKSIVDRDLAEARALGVTGTPTFFVNGRKLVGAQPLEAFKAVIDEALGLRTLAQPSPLPDRVADISISGSPLKGSPAAPVTIVEYSDLQCPFCARANPTLEQLLSQYAGKVQLVFKHFPLPMHADAHLAHQAALAAAEQGQFWQFHDAVFANQQAMKRRDLLRMARELGLDEERFIADLDSGRLAEVVDRDMQEGGILGVTGTPTFFINGIRLVGAQPLSAFSQVIDREILESSGPRHEY